MHNTLRLDTDLMAMGLFRLWGTANLGSLLAGLFMNWKTGECCAQSVVEFGLFWANLSIPLLATTLQRPSIINVMVGIMLALIGLMPALLICILFVYIGISVLQIWFARPKHGFLLLIALGPWSLLAIFWFVTGNDNHLGFWIVFIGLGSSVLLEGTLWLFDWASASPDSAHA